MNIKENAGYWQIEINYQIWDKVLNKANWFGNVVPLGAHAYVNQIRERYARILKLDPATPVPHDWPEAREALDQIQKDPFGVA